jgi:hypothetical protein
VQRQQVLGLTRERQDFPFHVAALPDSGDANAAPGERKKFDTVQSAPGVALRVGIHAPQPMSRIMSHGAARTKMEPLKIKGIVLQHTQHEKATSIGGLSFYAIDFIWLGREDSNLRMAESKSAALPLGYAPILPLQVATAGGLTIMSGAMRATAGEETINLGGRNSRFRHRPSNGPPPIRTSASKKPINRTGYQPRKKENQGKAQL